MPTVSFQNEGLIPSEAITVMGINAKEGESPIGFFGTGLKYSIASLLRTGQSITIYRGLERFSFKFEQKDVRGKEFGFIYLSQDFSGNDESFAWRELGFTTHLGAKWEQWQIFRELYSNTLDEKGDMEYNSRSPKEGFTTIIVEGEAFFSAAKKKDEIFLSSEPLHKGSYANIHLNASKIVYYRGVRAYVLDKPTKYTYNIIHDTDLTEDRTIKSAWYINWFITQTIMKCSDKDIIEESLFHSKGIEDNLDYSTVDLSSDDIFGKVVIELAERGYMASIPVKALSASEKWAQSRAEVKPYPLSKYEQSQLVEALSFLKEIGFTVTEDIIVTSSLGPEIYGMARAGKILLSKSTLDKGGNWLASTILEEHLHITQGFTDESRRFQNFLFDLTIKFARELVSIRKTIPND